jgi:hypothetical protein
MNKKWYAKPRTYLIGLGALLIAAGIILAIPWGHSPVSSQPTSPASGVTVPTAPANRPAVDPLILLGETGATVQPSGDQVDVEGDRFAYASYTAGGETVTATTFGNEAAQQQDLTLNSDPTDGSIPIVGTLWTVWVQPTLNSNDTYSWPVPLSHIAALVHGKITKP